jgi:hypothetical protein
LLPEPIPSEEPTTWPEQGLDKLILESPQFKRTISDAAKTHRAMWRGIIPADDTRKTPIPYESPKPIAYLPDIKRPEASVDFILVKNDSANPDYKKTAPITNRSDLLKALGLNTLEGSELEKEVLEVPQENPGEKKQEMPVQEGKINYDPKDCKRDNVDGKIIRCKEAPNKYQECMRANHIFKTWQCCKPDNHVN